MADDQDPIEKANPEASVTIFNIDTGESLVGPEEPDDKSLFGNEIIEPPLPPNACVSRYDESYALRPNIDAYVVNIEGFGHTLKPRIDLDSRTSDQTIKEAILMERIHSDTKLKDIGVEDVEVAARRESIRHAAQIERLRLDMFFSNPAIGMSLVQLRKQLRRDLEVTGNAYLEVVRNTTTGAISQVAHAPTVNMRLTRSGDPIDVKWKRRISPISYAAVGATRRFRRYVQAYDTKSRTYFKELGDPRLMSSATGKFYRSEREMKTAEQGVRPANEMIHIKLYDPRSPYGSPRWQGAMMAVIGGRASEEVNYAYFDEKTIPPGFLLVSGAPLKKGADKKIEQYLLDHIKGRRNFWSIVVIEAEGKAAAPGAPPPRAKIEWVPMTDQQQQDALFQNYDERNGEKIGNMFRLPKLLRGDMRDFNRSTADSALKYAEQQVFAPERLEFDELFNELLFVHMDVKYWRFVSNGPSTNNAQELAEILERVGKWLMAKEAREVVGGMLNRELEDVEAPWSNVPLSVYEIDARLAQSRAASQPAASGSTPAEGGDSPSPDGLAKTLAGLRDELAAAEGDEEATAKAVLRALDGLPRDVVKVVDADLFDPVAKPFAGYETFDACVLDQQANGHSEEAARRICGALQADAEGDD
jgi:PBSX family phage portal protein